ncbi:germ cell-specific gene 1-like protein [Sinocyclocheilus anshuiensis]|uniref:germ cell-specific gene 1-like protein n=1 Tax=Sinocyclocheilus anshuiensis TaxID=1608454 RepID=UPI0007B7964C|nr:PREDICTED: germ cell-specific gene 1-like protein [Sinocyclocheilus anshuiensis]
MRLSQCCWMSRFIVSENTCVTPKLSRERNPAFALVSMSLLLVLRSPRLSFLQTLLSLLLSLVSLSSSHWCVGRQKVPKPLCSPSRRLRCTPVHGVSDGSFSWETGDDRFIFPSFHAGLWTTCEENIFTDASGESSLNHSHVFILKVL